MTFILRLIDWLCRRAGVPEYSLVRDYAPISHIQRLSNNPDDVYVWVLREDVDREAYAANIMEQAAAEGADLAAVHIFVRGDVKQIRKLDPQEVRVMLDMYYSKNAQNGGRRHADTDTP